jgi:hypothetical protein
MRRWIVPLLFALMLTGCAGSHFLIPQKEYRAKVQVLGVLPLLVDPGSTIGHPQWGRVVALLRRQNAGKKEELIRRLRSAKGYFDVRSITGTSEQLFSDLIAGASVEGKGADRGRRYRFNSSAVADLARRNSVDGLLVLVMNGAVKPRKYWGRDHLEYLQAKFVEIEVYAAVVLPSGQIVWEDADVSGTGFLPLQYPDFDEAFYNRTDEVRIKYISIAGLRRILSRPGKSLFGSSPFPPVYHKLFENVSSALSPGLLKSE